MQTKLGYVNFIKLYIIYKKLIKTQKNCDLETLGLIYKSIYGVELNLICVKFPSYRYTLISDNLLHIDLVENYIPSFI